MGSDSFARFAGFTTLTIDPTAYARGLSPFARSAGWAATRSPLHQRLHQGGNWVYSGLEPGGQNGDPGKINKDRITMLAESLKAPLQNHLKKVKAIHERDLAEGWDRVQPEFAARLMDYGAIAEVSMPIRIKRDDKSSYGMEAAGTKGLVAAR